MERMGARNEAGDPESIQYYEGPRMTSAVRNVFQDEGCRVPTEVI